MIANLLATLAVPAAIAYILLETASARDARTVRVQFKFGADKPTPSPMHVRGGRGARGAEANTI